MKRSQIQENDGTVIRYVKNLGWLLRNWKQVEAFTLEDHPAVEDRGMKPEVLLTAQLRDGRRYVTGFMCANICRDWLNRPVFRGLPIKDTV